MSPDQVAFEGFSWLIVLVLAVMVAALNYETRPAAVRQRERDPEDDFRWRL